MGYASDSAFETEDYFRRVSSRNVQAQIDAELTIARNALRRATALAWRFDLVPPGTGSESMLEARAIDGFNQLAGELVRRGANDR